MNRKAGDGVCRPSYQSASRIHLSSLGALILWACGLEASPTCPARAPEGARPTYWYCSSIAVWCPDQERSNCQHPGCGMSMIDGMSPLARNAALWLTKGVSAPTRCAAMSSEPARGGRLTNQRILLSGFCGWPARSGYPKMTAAAMGGDASAYGVTSV